MDPNACLALLVTAIKDGEYDNAREHAENLQEWLAKGGFEPDWPEHWTVIDLPNGLGDLDAMLGELQWSSKDYKADDMDTDRGNLRALITVMGWVGKEER